MFRLGTSEARAARRSPCGAPCGSSPTSRSTRRPCGGRSPPRSPRPRRTTPRPGASCCWSRPRSRTRLLDAMRDAWIADLRARRLLRGARRPAACAAATCCARRRTSSCRAWSPDGAHAYPDARRGAAEREMFVVADRRRACRTCWSRWPARGSARPGCRPRCSAATWSARCSTCPADWDPMGAVAVGHAGRRPGTAPARAARRRSSRCAALSRCPRSESRRMSFGEQRGPRRGTRPGRPQRSAGPRGAAGPRRARAVRACRRRRCGGRRSARSRRWFGRWRSPTVTASGAPWLRCSGLGGGPRADAGDRRQPGVGLGGRHRRPPPPAGAADPDRAHDRRRSACRPRPARCHSQDGISAQPRGVRHDPHPASDGPGRRFAVPVQQQPPGAVRLVGGDLLFEDRRDQRLQHQPGPAQPQPGMAAVRLVHQAVARAGSPPGRPARRAASGSAVQQPRGAGPQRLGHHLAADAPARRSVPGPARGARGPPERSVRGGAERRVAGPAPERRQCPRKVELSRRRPPPHRLLGPDRSHPPSLTPGTAAAGVSVPGAWRRPCGWPGAGRRAWRPGTR